MSVRYKFKNDLSYSTLNIDGFHISVRDLKRAIVEAGKLGRVTNFDLIVTENDTDKVFANDEEFIPKNSSLVVARHPLERNQKKVWYEEEKMLNNTSSSDNTKNLFKSSIESASDMTEDEKINQMMSNSGDMFGQKNWLHLKGRQAYAGQKVPGNYRCNGCGAQGTHFIFDCPNKKSNMGANEIKRTTGIPRSFLVPATSETPGVKINPQGLYMVNQMEQRAYTDPKIDRPVWDQEDTPLTKEAVERTLRVPDDLKCPICQELFKDAVMIPCCASDLCDECARDFLIKEENTKNECPVCGEADNSPDDLIPNRKTRIKVNEFKNSHLDAGDKDKDRASRKNSAERDQKMPSLRDIPGITVPEGQFDAVASTVKKSPFSGPSPKAATPIDDEKDESTPRGSSVTPTTTPTPKASPPGTGDRTPTAPQQDPKADLSRPPPGYNKGPLLPLPSTLPTTIPSFLPPTSLPHMMPAMAGMPPAGIPAPYHPPRGRYHDKDPLEEFNRYLRNKSHRDHRDNRDRDSYRYRHRRSRSRSPPDYYSDRRRGSPRRSRYNQSPPARYRDSPPPKIERRAPPPPRGPHTPPHSPTRRSKTTTPPPGEESPRLPVAAEDDRQTPLNDEKEATSSAAATNPPANADHERTPSLSPEPREAEPKRHSSREYEQSRYYDHHKRSRSPARDVRHYRSRSRDRGGHFRPKSRSREPREYPYGPRGHRRPQRRSRSRELRRSPSREIRRSRSREQHRRSRSREPQRRSRSREFKRSPLRRSRSREYNARRSRSREMAPVSRRSRSREPASSRRSRSREAAPVSSQRSRSRSKSPVVAKVEKADKKEKKKKEKKKKRRRSDSGSAHSDQSESTAEPKKKSKKAKKAKKARADPEPEVSEEPKKSPEKSEALNEEQPLHGLEDQPPPPSPVKMPETVEEAKTVQETSQESEDDTLELGLHPEKSKWDLSDDDFAAEEPKADPSPKGKQRKEEPINVDNEEDDEKDRKKKSKKSKKHHRHNSSDLSEADESKKKRKKKDKKKKKDDTDTKLKKILYEKLQAKDADPKLIELANMLLDSGDGKKPSESKKSEAGKPLPIPKRNTIGGVDFDNFTVTIDRNKSPAGSSAAKGRKIKSRSPSPQARKKSVRDRLGPMSDKEPSFKNEHWNGKPKLGKNERNGRSDSKEVSNKRDRDLINSGRDSRKRRDVESDSRRDRHHDRR